jgi:hypothetical protein
LNWFAALAGRVLAIHSSSGLLLVDLVRGEELAVLPPRLHVPLRFEPTGNALMTYGTNGLCRWPVRADPGAPDTLRIGPPQLLHPSQTGDSWGSTPDGSIIAIPQYNSGAIVLHRKDNRLLRLGPQDDVRWCTVSPDGRWIATGTHRYLQGAGAKVWDAQTGRHVHDLPVGASRVGFSPDGLWLATSGGGVRLWRVGSWGPGPPLNSSSANTWFAFTPDSKLLALGDAPGLVRLVAPDTGKEIVRLPTPEDSRLFPLCFTDDGSQLVTVGGETGALHIIDLRAIRDQLRPLGLDWDAPPYHPLPDSTPPRPLRAEVIGAELGADRMKWKEHERNHAALTLSVNPFDAEAHYLLGRDLYERGQSAEARARLAFALALNPGHGMARYNRAQASARLGQTEEALADFNILIERSPTHAYAVLMRGHLLQRLAGTKRRWPTSRRKSAAVRAGPTFIDTGRTVTRRLERMPRRPPISNTWWTWKTR